MENIAHTLAGACIANTGFSDRMGRKTSLWLSLSAANLPDVDILTWPLLGHEHYLIQHRGISHSLLALLVVPPVLAWIARRLSGYEKLVDLWLLAFLSYASHLAMDLPTSWGTMLFAPFDDVRVGLDWVFIVDLGFWVVLTLPLWLGRFVSIERPRLNRIALLLLGTYVGLCGVAHDVAVSEVVNACERHGIQPDTVNVYPAGLVPLFWNGVASDEAMHYQARIQLIGSDETTLYGSQPRNAAHPAVRAVKKTALGSKYITWWGRSVYAQVHCVDVHKRVVVLGDLRFANPWLNREGFRLVFELIRHKVSLEYEVTNTYWVTPLDSFTPPQADCAELRKTATP